MNQDGKARTILRCGTKYPARLGGVKVSIGSQLMGDTNGVVLTVSDDEIEYLSANLVLNTPLQVNTGATTTHDVDIDASFTLIRTNTLFIEGIITEKITETETARSNIYCLLEAID